MDDNLPKQQGAEDKKLKELESELQELEKKARGELNQGNGNTPSAQKNTNQTANSLPMQQAGNRPQASSAQQPKTQQGGALPESPPSTPEPAKVMPNKTPSTPDSNGGGMRTVMWVALVLFLLAFVGAGGYYLGARNQTESPTPTPASETPTPSPTVSPVSGWNTYQSEEGWSIRYPSGVEVTENGAVSFTQFGPTQEEGTEFYDGISLTVRSGALGGVILEEFVDSEVVDIEDDPVSEVSDGPTSTEIAGLSGYRLTATGFGTFEYYYLPMGETSYVQIVDSTQDPTGQGFEETVNMMLETLKVGAFSASPLPSVTATPSAGI